MTTIEIYKKMLAYLLDNNLADNYASIARKAGVDQVQVSRVRNGHVKSVKDDTMRKVNAAFGNLFNPEWMRGESDVMLVADIARASEKVSTDFHQYAPQTSMPDSGSLVNAIIAANDQAIVSLKREVAAKEEVNAALRGRLADKDEIIRQKEMVISSLEQQLYELRVEKGLLTGHRQAGVPEQDRTRTRT